MNQAIHYIDLLDWLIGPVKSLYSYQATRKRNIEAEDTAVIAIEWEKGILGTMAVTMITYPKNLEGSITVIGENGSAKVGGVALNKYEYFYFDSDFDKNDILSKNYDPKDIYGSGHSSYYRNILSSLEGNEEAICSGYDGLKVLKLLLLHTNLLQEKKDDLFKRYLTFYNDQFKVKKNKPNLSNLLKMIMNIIRREKQDKSFLFLILVVTFQAFLDVLSVASVVPLIYIIQDKNSIENNLNNFLYGFFLKILSSQKIDNSY